MDTGAWRAIVHEVTKELDMTQQLNNINTDFRSFHYLLCLLQYLSTAFVASLAQERLNIVKMVVISEIGEGNGTPLQYSCLENPMDGGAWKAAVHGVTEGRT